MQRDYLAQQGIEPMDAVEPVDSTTNLETPMETEPEEPAPIYESSPQSAPENLTLPRPPSPASPPADPRMVRRLRNKRIDPRTCPRVKRFTCKTEGDVEVNGLSSEHEADTTEPDDGTSSAVKLEPNPVKEEFLEPSDIDLLAIEALKKLKKSGSPPPPQLAHDMKSDVSSTTTEEKAAPIRRKVTHFDLTESSASITRAPWLFQLSITEYLKRKKGGDGKSDSQTDGVKSDALKSEPTSPSSDDDISPLLLPTPTLPLPFLANESKGKFYNKNFKKKLKNTKNKKCT